MYMYIKKSLFFIFSPSSFLYNLISSLFYLDTIFHNFLRYIYLYDNDINYIPEIIS